VAYSPCPTVYTVCMSHSEDADLHTTPSSRQRLTVLIADDSALLRENIRKLVSGVTGDAELAEAETVHDTLARIRKELPAVLILDLQFPDGSGFDVLEHLDAVVEWPSPRPYVVVLTNFPSPQNKDRAMRLGADHFLDKSYEYEQLIPLLEERINQVGKDTAAQKTQGGE
jgi:two-component system, OmpR family, response regulator